MASSCVGLQRRQKRRDRAAEWLQVRHKQGKRGHATVAPPSPCLRHDRNRGNVARRVVRCGTGRFGCVRHCDPDRTHFLRPCKIGPSLLIARLINHLPSLSPPQWLLSILISDSHSLPHPSHPGPAASAHRLHKTNHATPTFRCRCG
jgi:hypothetical protein